MDLLTTLVVGAYLYTTGIFVWFEKRLNTLTSNHLQHLVEVEVTKQMEAQLLPSETEPESSQQE